MHVHDSRRDVTETTRVGSSSFALAYRITREGDGVLVAEGESVQVWLGEDGRSAPLPTPVRAALEGSLGEAGGGA